MKSGLIIAGLLAAAAIHASAATPPDLTSATHLIPSTAKALALHTGGRVAKSHSGYGHQWPGVYFEGAFSGDTVYLRLDDANTRYTLIVDGGKPIPIPAGQREYQLSSLGKGAHHIRLEKTSESYTVAGHFGGIYIPRAETPMTAPARTRQIEFIGDSYTSGFANTLNKQDCSEDEANTTTDTHQTYGPLTASHYNADYQINAYSGIGIMRNYVLMKDDPVLPVLYGRTLFDGSVMYDAKGWYPQIIIVAMAGNDFSVPFTPDARWKSLDDVRPDYLTGLTAFVKRLRQVNPKAQLILMDFAEDHEAEDTAEVLRRLKADGETKVSTFTTGPGLEHSTCFAHLSLTDEITISTRLTAYIDAHPEFWQGK